MEELHGHMYDVSREERLRSGLWRRGGDSTLPTGGQTQPCRSETSWEQDLRGMIIGLLPYRHWNIFKSSRKKLSFASYAFKADANVHFYFQRRVTLLVIQKCHSSSLRTRTATYVHDEPRKYSSRKNSLYLNHWTIKKRTQCHFGAALKATFLCHYDRAFFWHKSRN